MRVSLAWKFDRIFGMNFWQDDSGEVSQTCRAKISRHKLRFGTKFEIKALGYRHSFGVWTVGISNKLGFGNKKGTKCLISTNYWTDFKKNVILPKSKRTENFWRFQILFNPWVKNGFEGWIRSRLNIWMNFGIKPKVGYPFLTGVSVVEIIKMMGS